MSIISMGEHIAIRDAENSRCHARLGGMASASVPVAPVLSHLQWDLGFSKLAKHCSPSDAQPRPRQEGAPAQFDIAELALIRTGTSR